MVLGPARVRYDARTGTVTHADGSTSKVPGPTPPRRTAGNPIERADWYVGGYG